MMHATDLKPQIGTEVAIDRDTLLTGTHADELRELLVRRGVLLIRNMHLNDAELETFAKTVGVLRQGALHEPEGMLRIFDIAGSYFWHFDGAYTAVPPFAPVMTPAVLSPEGGETEFANTYAAFEDLPADEQAYLSTLNVVHSMQAGMTKGGREATWDEMEAWKGHRRTLPLVWRHKSGRRSLVLGVTASHVEGLHFADSYDLLHRLLAHTTQDRYVYRHSWQMGDVAVWNNSGTLHRVRPFDVSSGREMHRFSVAGVEPLDAVPECDAAAA
jgi:alpha-ketoglutarate-dependent taurine dioxygenase